MPYVCILPGCPTPNKLYEGRQKWYRHIWQAHGSASVTDGVHDCSICKKASLSTTTFQRYVSHHLEELALFSLPRTGSDEDENAVTDEETGDGIMADILSGAHLDDYQAGRGLDQRDNMGKTGALISDSHPEGESSSPFDDPALPRSTKSKGQEGGSNKESVEAGIQSDSLGETEYNSMILGLNGLTISSPEESIQGKSVNIPAGNTGGRERLQQEQTNDSW